MIQKVIKVGNSYAATIPKKLATSLGVSDKNTVEIVPQPNKGKMLVDFLPSKEATETIVDPEVYTVSKDLLKRYLPAFEELAKNRCHSYFLT